MKGEPESQYIHPKITTIPKPDSKHTLS